MPHGEECKNNVKSVLQVLILNEIKHKFPLRARSTLATGGFLKGALKTTGVQASTDGLYWRDHVMASISPISIGPPN